MRVVEVFVEDNDGCAGCALRFKAEDEPRPVRVVRWYGDDDRGVVCEVVGWSAEGEVAAIACTIEDSSAGTAVLVWGGDHGLRLTPRDGGARFGESHLRLAPDDVLE